MRKSAATVIILSFLITIAVGTVLLMLPPATTAHGSLSFGDALFTATSAVTVTGLIVKDTAVDFSLFGQWVILLLLQIGGLGFMTFSTFVILLMGKSFSLKDKSVIENDFTAGSYKNLKDLLKKIIIMTFSLELLGAVLLYFQFTTLSGGRRVFSAVFHSISAFCNAGFAIFSNSFESYMSHTGINFTLMMLIIFGGIGFLVLNELLVLVRRKKGTRPKLSLHSKLVLITSGALVAGGFIVILVEELLNTSSTLPLGAKVLTALFQSVSARTAGFNTINLNVLSMASIFIMLLLMFVGASPGSTGGGIKTSSTGVVVAYLRSRLLGRDTVHMFYRNIRAKTVEKAFIVIIISFLFISVFTILLLTFEPQFSMTELVFETVSAFGTVGLSMGITAKLSAASKFIIIVTMFIGRIGPLTLLFALSKRESKANYKYPEENIMIG